MKIILALSLLVLIAIETSCFRFSRTTRIIIKNQPLGNTNIELQHSRRARVSFSLQATDAEYEELLEDMIYSGDMPGFMRRKTREIVDEDFLDYLKERIESADDDDEKAAIQEIITLVSGKLLQTDGLADSGIVFESRLDRILFTAPNNRRKYIEENKEEMTQAFIEYIQSEMKSMSDIDSKVVLASILQMIGEVQGTDYLGNEAIILSKADASLGEQFAKQSSFLEGGSISDAKAVATGDKNEQVCTTGTAAHSVRNYR